MSNINKSNITKKTEDLIIKGRLKIYGYSYGDVPMKVDRNLSEVFRILFGISIPNKGNYTYDESLIKRKSKEFFDKYFKLHNVRTISIDEFNRVYLSFFKNCSSDDLKPEKLIDFCSAIEEASASISPLEIPILYGENRDLSMYGKTQKPMFLKNNDKYLRKMPIYFSNIELESPITMITPYIYIHEIIHTQLESVKGSVRDYQNSEVLPILVELIAAYEMETTDNVLNYILASRLRDIRSKILTLNETKNSRNVLLVNSIYLSSTLQALHLFDIYQNSSSETRKQMIIDIQEIFDGKQILENFMMKYGVNLKNSSDIILVDKHLKKVKK